MSTYIIVISDLEDVLMTWDWEERVISLKIWDILKMFSMTSAEIEKSMFLIR